VALDDRRGHVEIREMTGQTYWDHYAGEKVATSTDIPVSVTDAAPTRHRERELVGAR
jgi:hypothetical protein